MTETPQPLRWSKYPITFSRKYHWVHILDPGTYPLVVNPKGIALLPVKNHSTGLCPARLHI
jgi:hypothetical protein